MMSRPGYIEIGHLFFVSKFYMELFPLTLFFVCHIACNKHCSLTAVNHGHHQHLHLQTHHHHHTSIATTTTTNNNDNSKNNNNNNSNNHNKLPHANALYH